MNHNLLQAQKAIQNARDALRSGDRSAARRWAEQAAKLAPELEDPWLILASVANPRASVEFIERALKINPESPRARKGMQWALKRLQEVPSIQKTPEKPKSPLGITQAQKAAQNTQSPKKLKRNIIYPAILLALGCIVVIAAAWTASTTPVLASLMNNGAQPTQAVHPQVWARVEIAKPAPNSEPTPMMAAADLTLPSPAPTPTLELESAPAPTMVPPSSTTEPEPSVPPAEPSTPTPGVTSTPAGSLVLDILEDTPTPITPPTSPAPTAVSPPVGNGGRWIEVNLTEQRVYAWEGSTLMNSFIVSTGTWQTPTVTGTYHIWNKTRIQAMSGPGYYLPNVPWVMYFYKDYGFHGTYWHNNFGTPMSHGCVNLTIPDSEWLYNFASVGTTVRVHY